MRLSYFIKYICVKLHSNKLHYNKITQLNLFPPLENQLHLADLSQGASSFNFHLHYIG